MPSTKDVREPQIVWCSTAYTIKTLEENQRNSDRALLTSLSSRTKDSLAALVKFAAYAPVCISEKVKL